MINIAPLDYERYLALVGPFPLTQTVAKAAPSTTHIEELPQISKRMDLWHEFSAEGELERARLAQQGRQRTIRPPVHTGPEAEVAWNMAIETASDMSIGGETLNTPSLRVAANLYRPVIDTQPPAIIETS